jgi:hypothetical protein
MHADMSTWTVQVEECTWENVCYFSTYSCACDYEHGDSARGTVHMKNSWLLLYLFVCTYMSTGTVHVEQCTHYIDAYRWLDGGGAKTHTAGLDWVGIQFKFELISVGICSIMYTLLYTFSILRLAFCALSLALGVALGLKESHTIVPTVVVGCGPEYLM